MKKIIMFILPIIIIMGCFVGCSAKEPELNDDAVSVSSDSADYDTTLGNDAEINNLAGNDLFNTLVINNKQITLPCLSDEFVTAGLTPTADNTTVEPGNMYGLYVMYFPNGVDSIVLRVKNETDTVLSVDDCTVVGYSFNYQSFNSNYDYDVQNIGGIELNDSTDGTATEISVDILTKKFGKPDAVQDESFYDGHTYVYNFDGGKFSINSEMDNGVEILVGATYTVFDVEK